MYGIIYGDVNFPKFMGNPDSLTIQIISGQLGVLNTENLSLPQGDILSNSRALTSFVRILGITV